MIAHQIPYIPVLDGLDRIYGLSRATKDTTGCALRDFKSVHFYLHLDLLYKQEYSPPGLLNSLFQAIEVFKSHSWNLFIRHNTNRRCPIVHLDHLLSLWPKLRFEGHEIGTGTPHGLVENIAKDKTTDWQIRYYVATGQVNEPIVYGDCASPLAIRDAELAQLRYYASFHNNFITMAEVYGEDTTWKFGDEIGCVTRMRTPVTEFWPNVHFDAGKYDIAAYDGLKKVSPGRQSGQCTSGTLLTVDRENAVGELRRGSAGCNT
jgi:hypothetical protein